VKPKDLKAKSVDVDDRFVAVVSNRDPFAQPSQPVGTHYYLRVVAVKERRGHVYFQCAVEDQHRVEAGAYRTVMHRCDADVQVYA